MYQKHSGRFRKSASNRKFGYNRNNRRPFSRGRKLPTYDPAVFIKKASETIEQEYTPIHSFNDFHLDQRIIQNIKQKGYTAPTPIQDKVIPLIMDGKDVVGIANTGTGKTAAFAVPMIQKLLKNRQEKVLVIAPTRELAVQIENEFREIAKETYLRSALCIGGVGLGGQIHNLRRNPQIVVGTPGRLKDLFEHRAIDFRSFRNIILDEVDRMLDMGFVKDISFIVSKLASPRQSLFFSATLPQNVVKVMHDFTRNPVNISVKTQPTSANVDQDVVRLNGRDKLDVLDELLLNKEFEKVLVFGRTKHGIDKVERALTKKRLLVASIHGNKSQGQRQRALEMFKQNKIQVLLATDIASRGIDISNVTHVINYDLPETYEDYIHRIGRTGRANQKGKALTFID